jgi:hypothetical protein
LRIIDIGSKLKLQQDQLVEKDKEVSSWKRKPAEATKAQNDAIGSRYDAIEAKEVVSKQFQGLQEDYNELWERSYAVIKEKNGTINDVKTTTKRKNNEVLVRMSNGEKTSKQDEDWMQSHRLKSQGELPSVVLI